MKHYITPEEHARQQRRRGQSADHLPVAVIFPGAQPLFFGLRKGAVSLFQQNFQALCPADAQKGILVCRSEGNSQFFGKLLPRPGVERVSVHQNSVQIE